MVNMENKTNINQGAENKYKNLNCPKCEHWCISIYDETRYKCSNCDHLFLKVKSNKS